MCMGEMARDMGSDIRTDPGVLEKWPQKMVTGTEGSGVGRSMRTDWEIPPAPVGATPLPLCSLAKGLGRWGFKQSLRGGSGG